MTAPPSHQPVWHPFTQHGLEGEMLTIAGAQGACLTATDGRRIFDGISSWWVITHGHCHPDIVAAIQQQAATLDQVIFAGFSHEPGEKLARELLSFTPDTLAHVFYSDSGSTAVEVGLKMALGYWHNRGESNRTRILALEHAYHGDTIGTMSTGERGVFNAAYAPLLFDVGRIPFPEVGREAATLDALDAQCRAGDVAALIVEPLICGAGGMLIYSSETLAEMARICAAHNVLLIVDEVMTGFGRTGAMFACERAGVKPDILCLAKGLTGGSIPLAATLSTAAIFDAHLSTDRTKTFFHSSSFTANPIACAAACANLQIWRNEPVMSRVDALTSAHAPLLAELAKQNRFTNLRQIGTIAAMDLNVRETGYLANAGLEMRKAFLKRGVLLRPLGNTIYIMPPYCTTQDELSKIYDAIASVARELLP